MICCFFFFKQKTAYEMRISDWSSDVCSSDLWEEALGIATGWLSDIRKTDPRRLALFTGRDQSQALTGWWATQFGTPNFAAHGGFCSVNMAAGGCFSIGGSFWEFGEPDWEPTRSFLMFGLAADHDSNRSEERRVGKEWGSKG